MLYIFIARLAPPMDCPLSQLRNELNSKEMADVPSLLPLEKCDSTVKKGINQLQKTTLLSVAADPSLLPFINDLALMPDKADLKSIKEMLKGIKPVDGTLFDIGMMPVAGISPVTGTNSVAGANKSSFTTASGKALTEKKNENDREIDKECNVEEYIIERIKMEIIETNLKVSWNDIVGLADVKRIINEIVLWPISRPDLFTGLRKPPRGLLLFGPPGTGKTMIGKCIASQCNATFFSISASSLTSKWVGEGEKMVRALFYLARKMAPSVVFIDEIDSLLSQRTERENEGSRRIKTEFLVQFDGAGVAEEKHILIIGATNRPQEIDEAARRRLVKRIYVPLPEKESRMDMVRNLVMEYKNCLSEEEIGNIADLTAGYSGSDIFNLCREAALEPLREIDDIKQFRPEDMRSITVGDFKIAMDQIRRSVSEQDLEGYVLWNESYGSIARRT